MNYKQSVIKRKVENILMFPFVLLGKIIGKFYKLKSDHNFFLFFPSFDVGGSIKVNADIARLLAHKKPLIILSKKPKNNQFKELFDLEGVEVLDLHKFIDKKYIHFLNFIFRGILAEWINKSKNAVVFGGEAIFFYKILSHINKDVRRIELSHLTTWFNYNLSFVDMIDLRIQSTKQVQRSLKEIYTKNKLGQEYFDKLLFVDNKIEIPKTSQFEQNESLKVLFVGRGAPQKRVYLISKIASKLMERGSSIQFQFVGDVDHLVEDEVKQKHTLFGLINDKAELDEIYKQADILILTSAYEGLPIVVMDMIARGKVVLSTAVDGIPDYIKHKENGLLISSTNEEGIIDEGVELLTWADENRAELLKLSKNAYEFALSHFHQDVFDSFYKRIFEIE